MPRWPCLLSAPLLLAGDPVVIPVHLDPGAIPQEEGRFFAGRHLRAVCPTVAPEGPRGRRRCSGGRQANRIGRSLHAHQRWRVTLVLRVGLPAGGEEDCNQNELFHRRTASQESNAEVKLTVQQGRTVCRREACASRRRVAACAMANPVRICIVHDSDGRRSLCLTEKRSERDCVHSSVCTRFLSDSAQTAGMSHENA